MEWMRATPRRMHGERRELGSRGGGAPREAPDRGSSRPRPLRRRGGYLRGRGGRAETALGSTTAWQAAEGGEDEGAALGARAHPAAVGAPGGGAPVHVEVVGAACAPSPSARSPARASGRPESTRKAAGRGAKWDEDRGAGREFEARGGHARRKPTASAKRTWTCGGRMVPRAKSAAKWQKPEKDENLDQRVL